MQDDLPGHELLELLYRIARGDSDAFSRLYDLTSHMVYGLVLRVIRSPAMAEEVTQEIYLQIWEQAGSFDPARGSPRAWVATLAHRRAVDAVRRSQSSRDREEKVPAEMPGEDVAESVITTDERIRVREALSGLTDLQFEAIELAYYEGMTYREVADHLGAPLGTVKSRMRDGLLHLREILGNGDV